MPRFTDKEEAQRSQGTCPKSHSKWQSQDLAPLNPTPKPALCCLCRFSRPAPRAVDRMKECLQVPRACGQGSAQEAGEDPGSHNQGTAEPDSGLASDAPGSNPSPSFISTCPVASSHPLALLKDKVLA